MLSISRRNLVEFAAAAASLAAAGLPAVPVLADTPPEEDLVPPNAIRDYTATPIVDSRGQFILVRSNG
jgi:hypothetical protein